MNSNARFVARLSILSFLLSLEDELTHYASCVEKNRLAALCSGPKGEDVLWNTGGLSFVYLFVEAGI